MKVYLVGAGPGDPELITVKGKKLLEEADLIVYAGSLVNPGLLEYAKPEAVKVDSAPRTLEEIVEIMVEYARAGKVVVRLQTGDPALYGAVEEQKRALKAYGVELEWVPGVSSFLGAAARLGYELTVPDGTQTVILSRVAGRTPVPEKENLEALAKIGSTLVLFLSVDKIDEVVAEISRVRAFDTPVAVVYKATFPEEKIITGTLADIAQKVKEEKINKTALIFVGEFLNPPPTRSKLYAPDFTHGGRRESD
ncbi:precorrin-4 C(11)-methyltransferase [Carboxydothermus pertinax]|uniref:Precorrin-4 C(11)-methyltransferase n=1 Tax=Carboxydothermus pertinax TaxID=870242 RepID=A0A1L8CT33_9THEO|nr:precorrin-4 C(11)-methyltransferase [Carboxydothermus pertinax]GAV22004.1 precorrin-4 C(11)-methyltransferase [Carboxydothermus pertinax]